MGLPLPSIIASPPSSSPSAAGAGGSTGIAVTFPDGQTAIMSATALVKPAAWAGTPTITIGSLAYTCTDNKEQIGMLAEINAAFQLGSSVVVLNSTAAIPTGGAVGVGDVLASVPATGPELAPTDIIVSLTAPAPGAAPAKSFRTDGIFLLNGLPCTTQFINVFTVLLTVPPLSKTSGPANNGKVPLQYSDTRGSIQVPDYFQYV